MENLKHLLDALDPGANNTKPPDDHQEPDLPNLLHLKFPGRDRGAPFSAAEREKIRDMMDAFERIKHTCPVAGRAAKRK